jgi:hypothetical protein
LCAYFVRSGPGALFGAAAPPGLRKKGRLGLGRRALKAFGLEIDPSELDDQSGRPYLRLGRFR